MLRVKTFLSQTHPLLFFQVCSSLYELKSKVLSFFQSFFKVHTDTMLYSYLSYLVSIPQALHWNHISESVNNTKYIQWCITDLFSIVMSHWFTFHGSLSIHTHNDLLVLRTCSLMSLSHWFSQSHREICKQALYSYTQWCIIDLFSNITVQLVLRITFPTLRTASVFIHTVIQYHRPVLSSVCYWFLQSHLSTLTRPSYVHKVIYYKTVLLTSLQYNLPG